MNDGYMIVATLPEFQASQTGEYAFDVSFDKTLAEENTLVLFWNSEAEDLQGIFIGMTMKRL